MNKIKVVNNKIIPFVSDDVEINDNSINFNNNGNYFIDYIDCNNVSLCINVNNNKCIHLFEYSNNNDINFNIKYNLDMASSLIISKFYYNNKCNEEVNIVMGLDIGGDDYITKPFRVRELISRINAILRRKGKSQDSNKKILKFKNISIHTLEARVFKNNEEIFLTSAEYKLLLILIQNKNMVLSRAQILEKLWDVTYDFINDNTLSVYIKRLREKIEDDSSKPQYILTVSGLGYKCNGSDDNENTIYY